MRDCSKIYGRKRAGLCHSISAREYFYYPSGGDQTREILPGFFALVYMSGVTPPRIQLWNNLTRLLVIGAVDSAEECR